MKSLSAPAKINLALVVGPRRADGRHEVATVLQRIDLADEVALEAGSGLEVEGFAGDTLVRSALETLAAATNVDPRWRAVIDKRVPVAAGLGGGSSDAAAALRLANDTLEEPLQATELRALASDLGADVPFFLTEGPQLGTGTGTDLTPLDLPRDYVVLLVLPTGAQKPSTASVYDSFSGAAGFKQRRDALVATLAAGDLAGLPPNDLASSPLADELLALGAFRADVSGAGPAVYGLFADAAQAQAARDAVASRGETWIAKPAW
jgi:4-diphosphocytidyl-2-C-methyl-D-erythritol kinase